MMSKVLGAVALVVAPCMVPTKKLSWKRESHIWVDVLLGRLPGVLLLCKLLDPVLLLIKSAIAAILVCALGEVTALRLGSQVHSLISCKRT
jgi:hypothetical protein